jgi:CMP-N,N'-diacetyllegionaminic acid synthase
MKIVALINARGGSKGIKNKNTLKFKNTTLLGNSILQAKRIKQIQRIFVSTDNKKIAKKSLKYGAEVPFLRPKNLAKDNSPEILSIRHAINFFKIKLNLKPDYIVSLPTTSPLRSIQDIENCILKAKKNKLDVVFSITPSKRNPYFNMVEVKKNKLNIICKSKKKYFTRQSAPKCFDLTTVCYVFRTDYILKNSNLFSGKVGFVIIPNERAVDIDDSIDYNFVKFLANR